MYSVFFLSAGWYPWRCS